MNTNFHNIATNSLCYMMHKHKYSTCCCDQTTA